MVIFTVLYNAGLSTVEPRFNGLPRDWGSLFVISNTSMNKFSGKLPKCLLYRGTNCNNISVPSYIYNCSYCTRNSRTGKRNSLKLPYTYILSLSVCLAFNLFYHILTFFSLYWGIFMFVLVDFVRYNEDFIKSRCVKSSRFCSLHYTEILATLKKIVCYSIPRTLLYRGSLNQGSIL